MSESEAPERIWYKNHWWLHETPLTRAAPDLLEALKEVVRLSDRKHDAWDAARAAIAKAEGRTE